MYVVRMIGFVVMGLMMGFVCGSEGHDVMLYSLRHSANGWW